MSGEIGQHSFDWLLGSVPVIQQGIETLTKKGENGERRRRIGRRSEDFILTSLGTYATVTEGRGAMDAFAKMPDLAAQTFKKDGHDYSNVTNENANLAVLHVTQLSLEKKGCIANTNNLWLLRVEWSVRLVPNA